MASLEEKGTTGVVDGDEVAAVAEGEGVPQRNEEALVVANGTLTDTAVVIERE